MPHRYVCDVLEEMRKCNKTRNYAVLPALIEEAQTLVNRMESALGEKSDLESWHEKAKEEEKEYKRLLKKSNKMRKKAGEDKKKPSRY